MLVHPGNLVCATQDMPELTVCVCVLTHFLCHAHLHVLFLEVLHGLQGLLWVHLFVHCLHCLQKCTNICEDIRDDRNVCPYLPFVSLSLNSQTHLIILH